MLSFFTDSIGAPAMATTITCVVTNNDSVNALPYRVSSKKAPTVDGRVTGVTIGSIAASGNVTLTLTAGDELDFTNAVARNTFPT